MSKKEEKNEMLEEKTENFEEKNEILEEKNEKDELCIKTVESIL